MPVNAISPIGTTGAVQKTAGVSAVTPVSGADFKKMLFNELEKVNQSQAEATSASQATATGTSDSIHDAKISGMKAEITLEYAVSVNNKAIEAYKELMRLQL